MGAGVRKGPARSSRAPVPRWRLPRGRACARSVVRVKSGDWPGARLPTHRPSLLCPARGSAANLWAVTGSVQVDGSFQSEGPGQGVPSGGRVTALEPEAGLPWLPGLPLWLLPPARHSPYPGLSFPCRKAECCQPCPGASGLPSAPPSPTPSGAPSTHPSWGAPRPMPCMDLHVRRLLCCCSQMDDVAAVQHARDRGPSPASQHPRPAAYLSASPPWTGQTQATEPSRPSLAFEGHTEPSAQGSLKLQACLDPLLLQEALWAC